MIFGRTHVAVHDRRVARHGLAIRSVNHHLDWRTHCQNQASPDPRGESYTDRTMFIGREYYTLHILEQHTSHILIVYIYIYITCYIYYIHAWTVGVALITFQRHRGGVLPAPAGGCPSAWGGRDIDGPTYIYKYNLI